MFVRLKAKFIKETPKAILLEYKKKQKWFYKNFVRVDDQGYYILEKRMAEFKGFI